VKTHWIPDEAMGLTEEQVAERAKGVWEHFTPAFISTQVPNVNVDEVISHMRKAQRIFGNGRVGQTEATIGFGTQMPIMITFLGDMHLGSIYVDHDRLFGDLEMIKATPNCYIVFMANLIDNAIPSQFPANMLANCIPPDKQVVIMRQLVQNLDKAGKILAAVTSPCHEGWTWKHTGQDVNALIFGYEGRTFPILDNGGRLYLRMSKKGLKYLVVPYHQVGPFESNFNETHALRQMNRLNLGMQADVVAGGHKHFGAAETVYEVDGKYRKTVAYVRSGCYKGTGDTPDLWVKGRYGTTGEPSGQSVVLWSAERRLEAFLELDTAVKFFTALF
jgi:hypothetical protein